MHRCAGLIGIRSSSSRILGLLLVWDGAVLGFLISLPNQGWKINRRSIACQALSSTTLFVERVEDLLLDFYILEIGMNVRAHLLVPPHFVGSTALMKIIKALHGRLKSQRDGTGGKLTVDPPFSFRRERGTGKI